MEYTAAKQLVREAKSFGEIKTVVDGVQVSVFSYHYPKLQDFFCTPHAKWMRGLTFVHSSDQEAELYPMFPKFFNVNENKYTSLKLLKSLSIASVTEKRDGSLVMPVLIGGSAVFKTMKAFNNKQAKKAMEIHDSNTEIQSFVNKYIDTHSLLFEYTSPSNKIIIEYLEPKLVLIGMVNRKTLILLPYDTMAELAGPSGLEIVKSIEITSLDALLGLASTVKGVEGWVVRFTDGTMVKLKTVEYATLHSNGTVLGNLTVPQMISMTLDATLDDLLPSIEDPVRKEKAVEIQLLTNQYLDQTLQTLHGMLETLAVIYAFDKRAYITELSRSEVHLVGILMRSVGRTSPTLQCALNEIKGRLLVSLKAHITRSTSKVGKALAFLDELRVSAS